MVKQPILLLAVVMLASGVAVVSSAYVDKLCPNGSPPQECFSKQDPCALIRCMAGFSCQVNKCGGCSAACLPAEAQDGRPATTNDTRVYKGGKRVGTAPSDQDIDKAAHHPIDLSLEPVGCPDGSAPVQCFVDPCLTATCEAQATCVPDYCGGCNYHCRLPVPASHAPSRGAGRPGTTASGNSSQVKQTSRLRPRPLDSTLATSHGARNCTVNPCAFTLCMANTTCIIDKQSCAAQCVPVKPKPADSPRVQGRGPPAAKGCNTNPCLYTKCTATTTCVVDKKTCQSKCEPNKPPSTKGCKSNPCSLVRCGFNTTCVVDKKKCTAQCLATKPRPVSSKPAADATACAVNPCAFTTCVVNSNCVVDPITCNAACVPVKQASAPRALLRPLL